MLLKLMSDEAIPDHDNRKRFRLFDDVKRVTFVRDPESNDLTGVFAEVIWRDGERDIHFLTGNAYLMNDQGKTIQSFDYYYNPADRLSNDKPVKKKST